MNALDEGVLRMLASALALVDGERFVALVIYNDGENFSVGANIGLALFAANVAALADDRGLVAMGPEDLQADEVRAVPGRGAPSGMALGGGCEILLHCAAVQAHAETYIGPGRGRRRRDPGLGRLQGAAHTRWHDAPRRPGGPMPPVAQDLRDDLDGEGGDLGLRGARARLPARERRHHHEPRPPARRRQGEGAGAGAAGYQPPEPVELALPGPAGRAALDMAVAGFRASGAATPHDVVVARHSRASSPAATPTRPQRSPRTSSSTSSARPSSPSSAPPPPSPASSTCSKPASP
jgi:3-hydroxyacyl-CoA dehydrogenase